MSFISIEPMTPLAKDFLPGPMDVICCRGGAVRKHQGNVNFRGIVTSSLEKYSNAKSKLEKSLIVSSIVDEIRRSSPNGGFVKEKNGTWYEIGDHLAREKVGQSLRDSLHLQYRSSTKAKRRRRNEDLAKIDGQVDKFVQSSCKEVIDNIKVASCISYSDAHVQNLFNQANCKLLHLFKGNEERAQKKRIVAVDDSIDSFNWMPFHQDVVELQCANLVC